MSPFVYLARKSLLRMFTRLDETQRPSASLKCRLISALSLLSCDDPLLDQ